MVPREATGVNAMPLGGYRGLVAAAAAGLDIRLNCAVGLIADDDRGVTLQTQTGPLSGDAVVVTVPLSLLKTKRILFDPPLPAAKQAAIARIGYGGEAVLNKIFLRFGLASGRTCRIAASRCRRRPARGFFSNWVNLEPVQGAPVLVGFASGHAAARLDRDADDAVIVETALGCAAPHVRPPHPGYHGLSADTLAVRPLGRRQLFVRPCRQPTR